MKNFSFLKTVLMYAGAVIAFMNGSAFMSGKEFLLFHVPFGYNSMIGIVIIGIVLTYSCVFFVSHGKRRHFLHGNDMYYYILGKELGQFYDIYTVLILYCFYILNIAGAGATLNQYLGLPVLVGSSALAGIAALCVISGLKNLTRILGSIGPINILLLLFLCIYSICTAEFSISNIFPQLPQLPIPKALDNWCFSSMVYGCSYVLSYTVFVTALGAMTKNEPAAKLGCSVGITCCCIAIFLSVVSLGCNISLIKDAMIPNLILAGRIHPLFSSVFFCVLIVATFTASVPLLWTSVSRFTFEGTYTYKILTAVLAALGVVISLYFTFGDLIRLFGVLNGIIGFILLCFMVKKDILERIKKKGIV